MKFSSPLTILCVLLILKQTLFLSMADRRFIKKTCKGTPSYDLCFKTLLADPKSENADLTGLALIVVAGVKDKGLKTIKHIKALKVSRPDLKAALDECAKLYYTVVKVNVPLTNDALKLGNPKFGETGMADSAVEARACEMSFNEHGQKSPMTNMNKDVEDIANVARAIIRMLLM